MIIDKNHWLECAQRDVILGGAVMSVRRFLVVHFTGGWMGESSISSMRSQGLSAHLVIDRDGSITQCRPFNKTCGHAGKSKWKDPNTGKLYTGLNACSIGIEMANCGDLVRATYPSTMEEMAGKKIPRVTAKHKHGGPVRDWEIYPTAQIDSLMSVAKIIVDRYNLDDLIGHEDISRGRKTDPGPAMPMGALRVACGFPVDIPIL